MKILDCVRQRMHLLLRALGANRAKSRSQRHTSQASAGRAPARHRRLVAACVSAITLSLPGAAWAAADLQISTYTWLPDPVANGARTDFSLRITNNGPDPVPDAVVTINVSSRFEVGAEPDAYPNYCVLSGAVGAQVLTCSLPPLGTGDHEFTYFATARAPGSANTVAAIDSATVADNNPGNDSLTVTPAVQNGADLSITKDDGEPDNSIPAGGILSYTLNVSNDGPNATSAVRITDNLPAASDFAYASASGTNWDCSHSAAVVTCNYTGAATTGALPPVSVTGTVRATGGTITNTASVGLSEPGVLDPNTANNTAPAVVTAIEPGADLEAQKSMPDTIIVGDAVDVVLTIRNNGPTAVTGAAITDTFGPEFTLGALPAGCAATGQTVTCTAGTLASAPAPDSSAVFNIPVTAAQPTAGIVTNTATVSPPPGLTDAVSGNNSGEALYRVSNPNADLSVNKTKGPNPVSAGQNMTSAITVRNRGPSVLNYGPGSPLRVTDEVSADETFVSVAAPWTCGQAGDMITCELATAGTLAVDDTLSFNLVTQAGAGADLDLANTACTGSTAGSQAIPADGNPGNDCDGAGVRSTTEEADLEIIKSVGPTATGPWTQNPPLEIGATDTSIYFQLVVRNLGGEVARTVVVTDTLPNFINEDNFDTGFAVVSATQGTPTYTPESGRVSWTVADLGPAESETAVIRIDRPAESGTFTNTATVTSPDTIETNAANNSSDAAFTMAPMADMTVNAKTINPPVARVGVVATYTISVRNLGANPASNVEVTDTIDPSRFELVGDPTTTKPGASCAKNDATGLVSCQMGTFGRGETFQITQQVRARFPFGGATSGFPISHTNTASVTTTTTESDAANNSFDLNHTVDAPGMDLAISKQEPAGAEFDPRRYGEELIYDVRVSNFGPSRASNVVVTDTPAPPPDYTMDFVGFAVNPAGASATGGTTLYTPPAPNCAPSGATIVCRLHASDTAQNFLDQSRQVIFRMRFSTTGVAPTGSMTFTNNVHVVSLEQDNTTASQADQELDNNSATQTTTVLPSTDLEVVSKTRITASPVSINQPVQYDIVIRNNGTSPTTQVRVIDQLPSGFVLASPAPTADASGAASVSNIACTGTTTITCTLNGSFPASGDQVTIHLTALAAYPYSQALNTDRTNTARIEPGRDGSNQPLSRDSNPDNNSKTAVTQVAQSTIAGRVYRDDNRDNTFQTAEAVAGATLTLSGTDDFGNPISNRVVTTDASGAYLFDRLPAGTYSIVETQPSGLFDLNEIAGSEGGTVDNSAYGSAAAVNTIGSVPLATATSATGYDFQELSAASLEGYVYRDLNNNGGRDSGETGFAPAEFAATPHIRLTGVDYTGAAVDLTASVDSTGRYSFASLAPSDGSGYTVTQLVQPNGVSDGLDANGAGSVVGGSAGRIAPEDIVVGEVVPGAALTERNFGELPTSSLSGMVFLDPNANALRDGGETTGLAGAQLRLTGTNDLGEVIDCVTATPATGLYSFPLAGDSDPVCRVLRPGTYSLEITPAPGITHTGAYIGSLGGSAGGVSGANAPSPGAAVTTIADIVITAGNSAVDYNFGGNGEGLSGYVYIDRNNSGARDVDEPGIAGVEITLSGTTATGQDVCDLVVCTVVTDAAGAFSFLSVPGSDGAGFTLTQQAQSSPPLSSFSDGMDAAGDVAGAVRGVAGDDVISGIVLNAGELGANYAFGEVAGTLSGSVYIDADDNGMRDGGEPPIPGVLITLSGTTADGVDICTWRAALEPSLGCTATTDADGAYRFDSMPAGAYTLTESQPSAYADGRETAGAAGGAVDNGTFGSAPANNQIAGIALAAGVDGANYLFGERAVTLSGRVFKDPERDGADAGGEPGLPDVTINLLQGGTVIATTTTGPDGSYSFTNLPAGSYTVREIQPAGYGSSSPDEISVNLSAGDVQQIDFANTVSSLAGHVFVDANNDGVRQPDELPIEGVTVTLTGTDAAGGAVERTAVTDADGEFLLEDLLAGDYSLAETQPASYADGLDSAGSAGGAAAAGGDVIGGIALPAGVDATDYAFGERGRMVSGRVYVDIDRNGAFEPTDRPIEGVVIELQRPDGTVVATTTTAADGTYSFAEVSGGDYFIVEQQPASYGDGPENPTNRVNLAVAAAEDPGPIDFGEISGSLEGLVYNDTNNNGRKDPDEPVIAGVALTLTGVDAEGNATTRNAVTGRNGVYRFTDVPAGTFEVTETQPAGYEDGAETVGDAGGTAAGGDAITGIVLAPAMDAVGYLFGERGETAQLSGTVWLDRDHDRARDAGEPVQPDWTVELFLGDQLIATTKTGADGAYSFSGLAPGSGYRLRFRHPVNDVVFGGARPNENGASFPEGEISPTNPAGADLEDSELQGLTLLPGANVAEQSLPLDPAGVVYDSVRRTPVQGAIVEFSGPAGFDPDLHLLGGSGNIRQVTDDTGMYQYLLTAGAPSGVYTLRVTPPNGSYNPVQPSSIIPPCPGPLAVGATPDPMLVSSTDTAPPLEAAQVCTTGVFSTAYYLSFVLTVGVSADVLNNHIPLDPILEGAIEVTKTTPMVNVSRGGLTPYTITARNTLAGAITGVAITDRVPAGFRYREGSARIDGQPVEPVMNGQLLTWPDQDFTAGQEKRLELLLVVGSGVGDGEYTNQAFAVNPLVDAVISNVAEATVRIIPDPDFDCTDILGKAFNDLNANGVQDDGEPGLPGVRLATARGLLITTDADGRYHITCPMIANEERGSNFIVKLDERTLPTGFRMTTENPETVRLTRGKFATLNFGASLHRVVRLDVNGDAFAGESLRPEFQTRLGEVIAALEAAPSVLRLAYGAQGESEPVINRRMDALRDHIEAAWRERRDRYRLVIELETPSTVANADGGKQ